MYKGIGKVKDPKIRQRRTAACPTELNRLGLYSDTGGSISSKVLQIGGGGLFGQGFYSEYYGISTFENEICQPGRDCGITRIVHSTWNSSAGKVTYKTRSARKGLLLYYS